MTLDKGKGRGLRDLEGKQRTVLYAGGIKSNLFARFRTSDLVPSLRTFAAGCRSSGGPQIAGAGSKNDRKWGHDEGIRVGSWIAPRGISRWIRVGTTVFLENSASYMTREEQYVFVQGVTKVKVEIVDENLHAEVSRSENKQKIPHKSRCGRGSELTVGSRIRKGENLFWRL